MLNEGRQYGAGREEIDGNEYVDCLFDGSVLVYSGGELPGFERCRFTRIRLVFEGPALRTLVFLQAMRDPESGFDRIFAQIFPGLASTRQE